MDLEMKLAEAKKLIEEHNETLAKLGVPPFDADKVIQNIKLAGGTSLDRLRYFDHEDVAGCFFAEPNQRVPTILAKEIVKVFREGTPGRRAGTLRAEVMTITELLDAYDPNDPDSPVAKRLKELSRGESFLVFSGSAVDVSWSELILREVMEGYPGRETVNAYGKVIPVYKIGERPDDLVDENPLYPLRPLRPDGTCDQTGRSWSGVPLDVRQFLRIGIDTGTFKVDSLTWAHVFIDQALLPDALAKLRDKYRGVAIRYDILAKENKLPSLKMRLRKGPMSVNPGGLLEAGEKVSWR